MSHHRTVLTTGSEGTEQAAAELAASLKPGALLLLEGDLAAGKTTFVRGLARGLGGDPDQVSSPTFVIVQSYECREVGWLHHVDCYRLNDEINELRAIGIEDLLDDPTAIVAIEWPRSSVSGLLSESAPDPITIRITRTGDTERAIEIIGPEE